MSYKLLWLAMFVIALLLMGFGRVKKKKKIIFFGDSITELGIKPHGYISLIDSFIQKERLTENYELTGSGFSGNKVYDLYLRIDQDVISRSPDIVIIFIGVNDVWHKRLLGTGTDFDKFGKFYEAIVRRLQAANIKPVLCTPAVIGERTDNSNEQDGDLNLYSNWIRSFSGKNNIPLVDLRQSFINYNLQHNKDNAEKGILTTDKVHLNDAGNNLVATEIWEVIKKL